MTENFVWFAVESEKNPKELRKILYTIEEVRPPKGMSVLYPSCFQALGDMMFDDPQIHWYVGKTYFLQLTALKELWKKFGDDLVFFGFTTFDCDFSTLKEG